jgi:hypothetical protein
VTLLDVTGLLPSDIEVNIVVEGTPGARPGPHPPARARACNLAAAVAREHGYRVGMATFYDGIAFPHGEGLPVPILAVTVDLTIDLGSF